MNTPSFLTIAQGGTTAAGTAPAASAGPSMSGTTSTAVPAGTPVGATPPPPAGGLGALGPFLPLMVIMTVLLFVLPALTNRKEKKKRAALMSSMKRGDRVLTIGGIIGTIDQMKDDEIMLKIDPNSNAKMTFTRASIQQVLTSSNSPATTDTNSNGTVEVKVKGDKAVAAR